MNQITLDWQNYQFFPYEKKLGLEEVKSISKNKKIFNKDNHLIINDSSNFNSYDKLTYFSKISYKNKIFDTIQAKLENTRNGNILNKKQFTRYSVHGLHDYKGKFNPQIVKSLINILQVNKKNSVLDPYCGSGTALIECTHQGIASTGFDINPLAVYITNSKQKALSISAKSIKNTGEKIIEQYKIEKSKKHKALTEREVYLKKWFPENTFNDIESLFNAIKLKGKNHGDIFYCIGSNLLRDYSLQEPADLRIRKRKSPFPKTSFSEKFKSSLELFYNSLHSSQNIIGKIKHNNRAHEFDTRYDLSKLKKIKPISKFDCVITSPPYATALPYIDTQRLSLVWLDLIKPSKINSSESLLIGSRESSATTKIILSNNMIKNTNSIPNKIWKFCLELNNAISPSDGFRRMAVPYLLYRYFSDMGKSFKNISSMVEPNCPFAMIVGNNQTTLGGKLFNIDTSSLLISVAKSNGWKLDRKIPLETYQRYGLHHQNAVKVENLIIFRQNE